MCKLSSEMQKVSYISSLHILGRNLWFPPVSQGYWSEEGCSLQNPPESSWWQSSMSYFPQFLLQYLNLWISGCISVWKSLLQSRCKINYLIKIQSQCHSPFQVWDSSYMVFTPPHCIYGHLTWKEVLQECASGNSEKKTYCRVLEET